MELKKLVFVFIFSQLLFFNARSDERRKPLTLKELHNINGPSYVPIPYPQTDEEVITDLKYFWNMRTSPSRELIHAGEKSPEQEKVMKDFLNGGDAFVGEIIRVKNNLAMWEKDYTFLIRLKNHDNLWLGNICVDSNGLWRAQVIANHVRWDSFRKNQKESFKPYSDKTEIVHEIRSALGYQMAENEIQEMQLVDGQCKIADVLFPAWEIILNDGQLFYRSFKTKALYSSESILDKKSADFQKMFLNSLSSPLFAHFNETVNDRTIVLKEIWREK